MTVQLDCCLLASNISHLNECVWLADKVQSIDSQVKMKQSTCHHHQSSSDGHMLPDYTRRSYNLTQLGKQRSSSTPSPQLIASNCDVRCVEKVNASETIPFHAKIIAFIAGVSSVSLVSVLLYYTLNGKITILQASKVWSPASFASKLEFTARYWILPVFWITFNILTVISRRIIHPSALNPLASGEMYTRREQNILRNSLEQIVISIISQVIMLTYLEGEQVSRLIPMINVLFFVGRITFWIGYPLYRTFGFVLTFLPSFLMVFFSLYRFLYSHLDVIWIDSHTKTCLPK